MAEAMTIPRLPWTRRKRDGLLVRTYAGGRAATVVLVMPEGRYRWRIEGNGDDDVTVEGYGRLRMLRWRLRMLSGAHSDRRTGFNARTGGHTANVELERSVGASGHRRSGGAGM